MADAALKDLLKIARASVVSRTKKSFVDAGTAAGMPPMDPSMMGGMDPSMMGGMDPSMMGGMDPSMMGGGAPAGGAPAGVTAEEVRAIVTEALQQSGMGGGAGGGGMLKPKIDTNVELMQIKNMLAKIVDALGIPVPAQDMVATPEKLMAMAQGGSAATASGGGAGGEMTAGAIPPIDPMQGAAPSPKTAEDEFRDLGGRAAALARLLRTYNAVD